MWVIKAFKDYSDRRDWKLGQITDNSHKLKNSIGLLCKSSNDIHFKVTEYLDNAFLYKTERGAFNLVKKFESINNIEKIKINNKFYFIRHFSLCIYKISKEEYYKIIDEQIELEECSHKRRICELEHKKIQYK